MSTYTSLNAAGKTGRRRNGAIPAPAAPAAPVPRVQVRVERGEGADRCVRVIAALESGQEIELSRTLVSAIAHALWLARGEDHLTNWFDAETVLNQLSGAQPPAAPAPQPLRAGRAAGALKNGAAKSEDGKNGSRNGVVKSAALPDDDLLPAMLSRPSRARRL